MRFTILTQYYLPETGAPQNRLHSLARNLILAGHEVCILTAMPNYPKMRIFPEYSGMFSYSEKIDGIDVRRGWIYASESKSVIPRLMNYFSFVLSSLIVGVRMQKSDFVLCESPPLFLGISAVVLAKRLGARLIFNVSDLWPESAEKLGIVQDGLMLRSAYRLEKWLYERSYLVTGQTQGIVRDISKRFPAVPLFWLPNGVDRSVLSAVDHDDTWLAEHGIEGKKVFIYAGILGHAQGLEVILKAAAELRRDTSIAFVVVGDGPLKNQLQELNRSLDAGVVFIPSVPKEVVVGMVSSAYAYVIPLRKLDLFKGAIPSKIFDPLFVGVPVLLGVDGEAKDLFIDQGKAGLFFEPENERDLVRAVLAMSNSREHRDELGGNGNKFVTKNFDCQRIASDFLERLEGP